MKKPARRKLSAFYYLIPVVYVGVILLFLVLQFSAREGFQDKVGNLLVAGSRSRRGLFGSGDVAAATVAFNDLSFDFGRRSPLLVRDSRGSGKRLALRSTSMFAEGAELSFSEDVSLRFSLTGRLGDRLELTARLPQNLGGMGSIEIPFRVEGGVQRGYPGLPLVEAENSAGRFFVSLPRGSVVGEGRLTLALADGGEAGKLVVERIDAEEENPYLYWYGRHLPTGAAAELPARRREFRERAYRTWQRKPLGSYESLALAEAAGAALFNEALERGEYRSARDTFARNIRALLNRSPGQPFPRQTSPYLGSLPLYLQARQAEAARTVGEITRRITRQDLEVFLTPGLVPLVLNHGPFSVVEEAVRLAEGANLESASGRLLLGLLETLLEARRWIGDSPGLERQALAIINTRLLPALESRQGELFLRLDAQEAPDVLLSLSAGKLIAAAGELWEAGELTAIGDSLISSALRLADETGSLPRTWTPETSAAIAGSADRIPPEAVYALAAEAGYLPREYSLYRVSGPGSWIWSAAGIAPSRAEANRQRFSFSFPAGEAHYLLIQGIPPFSSLEMHGISWNPDPQYFSYSDGWTYEEETQTLFVKLTHGRQEEEIVLSY